MILTLTSYSKTEAPCSLHQVREQHSDEVWVICVILILLPCTYREVWRTTSPEV